MEGFIIYVDLDKSEPELHELYKEIEENTARYLLIPKMTSFEVKKIMESFVNEKVYDVDNKEKLLDIIQGKDAREHFLEFIYDQHAEMEKWQQYYQERSRIRIIEWLRGFDLQFVFEEDLEISRQIIEKVKEELFEAKGSKDVTQARKILIAKSKTYYSNDALHPRPKRGRPPKQAVKMEIEPEVSIDIYTTVPKSVRPFLFIPDISVASLGTLFSAKFENEDLLQAKKEGESLNMNVGMINAKLEALESLKQPDSAGGFGDEDDEDDEDEDDEEEERVKKAPKKAKAAKKKTSPKKK